MHDIKRVVVDDYFYGEKGFKSIKGSEKGDSGYLAPISPLALNENTILINVNTAAGKYVTTQLKNKSSHFIIKNSAKIVAGNQNRLQINTSLKKGKTLISIRGSLGKNRSKPYYISKRVYNPSNHYIHTLMDQLNLTDIPIERQMLPFSFFSNKTGMKYVYQGKTLRKIIRVMNKNSSNFIAESLQTFLGAILNNDHDSGISFLHSFMEKITKEKLTIYNGSGLGRGSNTISPKTVSDLLKKMYKDPYRRLDFFSSLPVAGEDGTLSHTDYPFNGYVRAKTGTLKQVCALSGIIKGKSERYYLFTFVLNNYPSRNIIDMKKDRDRIINSLWEQL